MNKLPIGIGILIVVIALFSVLTSSIVYAAPPQYEISFGDAVHSDYLPYTDYSFTDLDGNQHGEEYLGWAFSVDVETESVLSVRVVNLPCRVNLIALFYNDPNGQISIDFHTNPLLFIAGSFITTDGGGILSYTTNASTDSIFLIRAISPYEESDGFALDYIRFACDVYF